MGTRLANGVPSQQVSAFKLRITNKRKPFDRDYDIHGHKLEEVESTKRISAGISTSTKSQKRRTPSEPLSSGT
jgi:hypothetical protein